MNELTVRQMDQLVLVKPFTNKMCPRCQRSFEIECEVVDCECCGLTYHFDCMGFQYSAGMAVPAGTVAYLQLDLFQR